MHLMEKLYLQNVIFGFEIWYFHQLSRSLKLHQLRNNMEHQIKMEEIKQGGGDLSDSPQLSKQSDGDACGSQALHL